MATTWKSGGKAPTSPLQGTNPQSQLLTHNIERLLWQRSWLAILDKQKWKNSCGFYLFLFSFFRFQRYWGFHARPSGQSSLSLFVQTDWTSGGALSRCPQCTAVSCSDWASLTKTTFPLKLTFWPLNCSSSSLKQASVYLFTFLVVWDWNVRK